MIDDVGISPGDWLHGDRDGMVRIRSGILEEVLAQAPQAMSTESKVRTVIRNGMDPQEAYIKCGKF